MNRQTELKKRANMVAEWLVNSGVASSKRSLAAAMKYNPSSLSQILTGKATITPRFISRLCAIDRRVNEEWINTGEGEMLLESDGNAGISSVSETLKELCKSPEKGIDESCGKCGDVCALIKVLDNQATVMTRMGALLEHLMLQSVKQDSMIKELNEQLGKLKAKREKRRPKE